MTRGAGGAIHTTGLIATAGLGSRTGGGGPGRLTITTALLTPVRARMRAAAVLPRTSARNSSVFRAYGSRRVLKDNIVFTPVLRCHSGVVWKTAVGTGVNNCDEELR